MSFQEIKARVMRKMADRRRIGPFDWSGGSWDDREAGARAYRIACRLRGERISKREYS